MKKSKHRLLTKYCLFVAKPSYSFSIFSFSDATILGSKGEAKVPIMHKFPFNFPYFYCTSVAHFFVYLPVSRVPTRIHIMRNDVLCETYSEQLTKKINAIL